MPPSLLLAGVFSFLPSELSGVLNPFFSISCHVTAVYAGQARGGRARALCVLHARVCVRRVNVVPLEFRYYPRSLSRFSISGQRFPALIGPREHAVLWLYGIFEFVFLVVLETPREEGKVSRPCVLFARIELRERRKGWSIKLRRLDIIAFIGLEYDFKRRRQIRVCLFSLARLKFL